MHIDPTFASHNNYICTLNKYLRKSLENIYFNISPAFFYYQLRYEYSDECLHKMENHVRLDEQ